MPWPAPEDLTYLWHTHVGRHTGRLETLLNRRKRPLAGPPLQEEEVMAGEAEYALECLIGCPTRPAASVLGSAPGTDRVGYHMDDIRYMNVQ